MVAPFQVWANYYYSVILEERNLKIATEIVEWPRELRRASINSFGYGGANGHVILESVQSYLGHLESRHLSHAHVNGKMHVNGVHVNGFSSSSENCPEPLVLPVSAASAVSLELLTKQILEAVAQVGDEKSVRMLANTLSQGRDTLQYRGCVLATYDQTASKYIATAEEGSATSVTGGAGTSAFGFVFTGQGAQYAGMAKELLIQSPLFRDSIRGLDKALQALSAPYRPSWTLEETLMLDDANTSRINEVTHSQPICTAVQVGLVDLLRSWGVQPISVVGHSSGEIAAAYAAGLLDANKAILAAYFRGYAVGELRSQGAMLAAGLGPEEAKALLADKGLQEQVTVACVNAPSSVTLSGASDAIEVVQAHLQGQNKFARKLVTGGRAYHSHMMEEIGPLYEKLLTPLFLADGAGGKKPLSSPPNQGLERKVKMYSSVGHDPKHLRIVNSEAMGTAYWRQNLEKPVQFSAALSSLAGDAEKIHLIELGPHSALKGPIQQIRKSVGLDEKSLPYSPTLVRNEDASLQLKRLAGTLFKQGTSLSWANVNGSGRDKTKIMHTLAPYPWDYSGDLLWSEPRASTEMRNRKHIRHELLGTMALTGNGIDYTWRNILKPSEMPWIEDHKLEDQVVFPAAGYLAMAIEAVSQIAGIKKQLQSKGDNSGLGFHFRNVKISAALNVPGENDSAGKDLELHTTMYLRKISGANTSADWHDFSISSFYWTSKQSTLHCTGSIRVTQAPKKVDDSSITVEGAEGFDLWSSTAKWYSKWHDEGLCFGPQFQSLSTLRTDSARRRQEAIATAKINPQLVGGTYEYYPVHPITIDAGFQAACLSGTSGQVTALKTWLPVFIAEAYIQPSVYPNNEAEGEIHVKSEEMGFTSRRIDAVSSSSR